MLTRIMGSGDLARGTVSRVESSRLHVTERQVKTILIINLFIQAATLVALLLRS